MAIVFAPWHALAATAMHDEAISYRLQGYQLQAKGSLEEAIMYYEKAVALDATYPTPHNDLGVIYEQQGRLEEAEREYRRALELDPSYLSAHSNLALLYEKQGQVNEAARHWEQRAALGAADDPWTQRARERLTLLQPQRSQPFLAESVTVSPHSPEAVAVAAPASAPLAAVLPVATPITMGASSPQPSRPAPLPTGFSPGGGGGGGQAPPYPTSASAQAGYGSTPLASPSVAARYPQQPVATAPSSWTGPSREAVSPPFPEEEQPGGWKRWVPFRRYIPFMGDKDEDEVAGAGAERLRPTSASPSVSSGPASRSANAADAEYQRGVELYRQERYAEAWDVFRKAQDLDPGNAKVARYLERSEEALQEQQRQQVVRRTDEAKQQDLAERERVARRIEDHYIRGRLYYEQGAYTKAKAEFEQILAALLESQLIR